MKFSKTIALVSLVLSLVVSVTESAVYTETWTTSNSGWKIKTLNENPVSYGSIAVWGSDVGGNSEVLKITASTVDAVKQDIIYADSTSSSPAGSLAGNVPYVAAQYIEFDFYANMAPIGLSAYFKGANVIWLNEITSVTVSAWDKYQIPISFGYGEGWYRPAGGELSQSAFNASAADVDEIGIMIWYANSAGQVYGIDNFSVVPEPETWFMLGFALISVAFTFRQQLNESFKQIAVRIR